MVVLGAVLDSTGAWSLGVLEAEDEDEMRGLAAGDPVVVTRTAEIVVGRLLPGVSASGTGRPLTEPAQGHSRRRLVQRTSPRPTKKALAQTHRSLSLRATRSVTSSRSP
jgi:hypothetical protein